MTKNVLAIILWFGVDYSITLMSYDGMLFNNKMMLYAIRANISAPEGSSSSYLL
jgi:hypothetical protein